MDEAQRKTHDAIVAWRSNLIPSLDVKKHIKPHSLTVENNILDGIKFDAVEVNSISGIRDVGGLGKEVLPIGLSTNVLHLKNSTVQANWFWNDGRKTIALPWGGTFDRCGLE